MADRVQRQDDRALGNLRKVGCERPQVEALFGIAGGKPELVELVFDTAMAGYIRERVWHESQTLEDRPDGSVVLRLNVAVGFELKAWIKSFAPHARVLEPARLREEIAAELRAALQ